MNAVATARIRWLATRLEACARAAQPAPDDGVGVEVCRQALAAAYVEMGDTRIRYVETPQVILVERMSASQAEERLGLEVSKVGRWCGWWSSKGFIP